MSTSVAARRPEAEIETPSPTSTGRLIGLGDLVGFVVLHVAAVVGVVVVGVGWWAIALFLTTYSLRVWGVCAGFHRYFSHRSFTMSRPAQFAVAVLGTTAMQKGVLWWVSTHRRHHRLSDTALDPHSPHHRTFLYSHCGWVFDPAHQGYDRRIVADLARFPELVWLERLKLVPVAALAGGLWLATGPQGFVWGFCVSTVLLWHTTLATGSFSHRVGGYRNYATDDDSRNSRVIAALLLGEGWHNNHHRAPNSARHSTGRHEFDPIYTSIRLLAAVGVVHSIRDTLPAPDPAPPPPPPPPEPLGPTGRPRRPPPPHPKFAAHVPLSATSAPNFGSEHRSNAEAGPPTRNLPLTCRGVQHQPRISGWGWGGGRSGVGSAVGLG